MATEALTGFQPNWKNKYEIAEPATTFDENGYAVEPEDLMELADGIQTIDPSNDEETEDYTYYASKGGKESEITSVSISYGFKGHRKYAKNDAQSFIRAKLAQTGGSRTCFFKHTEPDGRVLSGNATISGIVHTGGDANARGNFEVKIAFIGLPKDEVPATV